MRLGNGTELLGANDPRGARIGIIYVAPNDERKEVLAAILTHEKIKREQIAIVLPPQNQAFQRPQDFDDLKNAIKTKKIRPGIVFVAPSGPGPAEHARQRKFEVYSSLESYTTALRDQDLDPEKEKKGNWLFGKRSAGTAGAGAIAGAALAGQQSQKGEKQEQPQADEAQSFAVPPMTPPGRTPLRSLYADQKTIDIKPPAQQDQSEKDKDKSPGVAGPLAAGAVGAAAGYGAADALHKSSKQAPDAADDDWDALPPTGETAVPSAQANSAEVDDLPTVPLREEDKPANPAVGATAAATAAGGIIELKPKRSTAKLAPEPEKAAPESKTPPAEPTPIGAASTPTRRRRTDKMPAAVPAAAAGVAIGAGTAIATATRVGASRPPVRGNTFARGATSGGGGGGGRGRILIIALLILLTLGLGGGVALSMQPQLASTLLGVGSAKISMTPDTKPLQQNYIIKAVPGDPNVDRREVAMRTIESKPEPLKMQVDATGKKEIAATQAVGTLVFRNTSGAPASVPAGIIITASNGVQVVTESPANLPAGNPAAQIFPEVSVKAHTVQAGPNGNIPAGSTNQNCCHEQLFIVANNPEAFTGGVAARSYTFLQQSDVDKVADSMKTEIQNKAKEGIAPQLEEGEQVGSTTCSDVNVTADKKIGDQGEDIKTANVTVAATCSAQVFDHSGAQKIASDTLKARATTDLGKSYVLSGEIITQVGLLSAKEDSLSLNVVTRGVWYYSFSEQEKEKLAKDLAGKNHEQAQKILNDHPGIKDNSAKIEGSNPLPSDPNQIELSFLTVPGAKPAELPKPTVTVIVPPAVDPTPGNDEPAPGK